LTYNHPKKIEKALGEDFVSTVVAVDFGFSFLPSSELPFAKFVGCTAGGTNHYLHDISPSALHFMKFLVGHTSESLLFKVELIVDTFSTFDNNHIICELLANIIAI